MEALDSILADPSPFPNGLYWVASSSSRLLPAAADLLKRARLAGVDVAIVECATFDELAADIAKAVKLPKRLFDRVMAGRPAARLVPVTLPTAEARSFPVLRYSALLIEAMPANARRMTLATPTSSSAVRELLKEKNCKATVAANGRELAVFGKDQEILDALSSLGAKSGGEVTLDPVSDSWALGLLYDALVKSLVRGRPLIPRYRRSGHSIVVAAPRDGEDPERTRLNTQALKGMRDAYGTPLTGTVPGLGFPFQEGVFLKLDLVDGRWWCGFEPFTFVQISKTDLAFHAVIRKIPGGVDPDPIGTRPSYGGDPAGDWRRERWSAALQQELGEGISIDAWAQPPHSMRATETSVPSGFEDGTEVNAMFEVAPITGWSRPGHHNVYFDRTR